jgi:hypothetical protein
MSGGTFLSSHSIHSPSISPKVQYSTLAFWMYTLDARYKLLSLPGGITLMKRLFAVALMTCLAIAVGGTLIAHAGESQPFLSTYVYDATMARYLDIDMDSPDAKPEVDCVGGDNPAPPTTIRYRSRVGDWRIVALWPAESDQCTVTIENMGPQGK